MAESQVRVVGSGWTTFSWQGQPIALAKMIRDTAPAPVVGAEDIQALDDEHPREIVTPRAVRSGTLVLTVYELWNINAWETLGSPDGISAGTLAGAHDILAIFKRQVKVGAITCQKIIAQPNGPARLKNYYGCVVTDVDESEQVALDSMSIGRTITIRYTHAKEA